MGPDKVREIWTKFDELIAQAATPEAAANLRALKLQAELMNGRLFALEHSLGMLMRQIDSVAKRG